MIADDELHAYVDGALPPARAAEVEAWLAQSPEDAARVRLWREQIDELHRLFDPVLDEPIPARLDLPRLSVPRRRRLAPLLTRIAASLLLLGLGGAGGWLLRGEAPGRIAPLAGDALAAHVVFAAEVRHPVEVAAADQAHLVGWLSKRLGAPLEVPDLTAQGFQLVGGRLLPASSGPAAQFMYEDVGGQRLTIYLRRQPGGGDTAFRFASAGGAQAFYWQDNGFGYALAGTLSRAALMPVANAIYRQTAE